jgi:uncharacterized membrane protein
MNDPVPQPIANAHLRDAVAAIAALWRPLSGFTASMAVAWATVCDPTPEKMWIAAAVGGVGAVAHSFDKFNRKGN